MNKAMLCLVSLSMLGALAPNSSQARLTDFQIAGVLLTTAKVQIQGSEQAMTKTQNFEVRRLAQTLKADHEQHANLVTNLLQKNGVEPLPCDLSKQIEDEGKVVSAKLGALTGSEFDIAYVNVELDMLQKAMKTMNETLIPDGKNNELRQLSTQALPTLRNRLEWTYKLKQYLEQGGH